MIEKPDDKAPLVEHLIELRQRLLHASLAILLGFLLSYAFAEQIYLVLLHPLKQVSSEIKMIYTGLHEAFFTYLKVSFYSGLFLAIPYVLWQIWLFIAPGLYVHERRAILPFLIVTPILFFGGGAFAFVVVMPLAFSYFLSFSTPMIEALPRVGEYLSLVGSLIFAFGMTFEMPVILMLLIKTRILSSRSLIDKRRYAIVGLAVVSAVITPPDPLSMMLLLLPLLAMYEISILGGRWIERSQRRSNPEEETINENEEAEQS